MSQLDKYVSIHVHFYPLSKFLRAENKETSTVPEQELLSSCVNIWMRTALGKMTVLRRITVIEMATILVMVTFQQIATVLRMVTILEMIAILGMG